MRAAASGRRPHATVRLCPASKNSATITPWPRTSASACSRCRARDVTGSCQSSVDTRALVFAVRETDEEPKLAGLPELRVHGLGF